MALPWRHLFTVYSNEKRKSLRDPCRFSVGITGFLCFISYRVAYLPFYGVLDRSVDLDESCIRYRQNLAHLLYLSWIGNELCLTVHLFFSFLGSIIIFSTTVRCKSNPQKGKIKFLFSKEKPRIHQRGYQKPLVVIFF